MTRLLIILSILILTKNKLLADSLDRFKPDTIYFSKGFDKLDSIMKMELDSLAIEIKKYPNQYFSVTCYKRKGQSSKKGWSRGANIITYLVRQGKINREDLILTPDLIGNPEMVIVRFSLGEEESGTHCGFPIFPELKK